MGKREYGDEDRAQAIALLSDVESSLYDVNKATGIPTSTLCMWAQQANLPGRAERSKKTAEVTKARLERISAKREALREKLLDVADEFLDCARDVAAGVIEVNEGVFVSGGKDARELMTASAIALDKFRLEMGESTTINENRDANVARRKLEERLDEVAAKRSKRQAS